MSTLAIGLGLASPAAADEGQWTPEQIAALDFDSLRARGLELTPAALWSEDGGLLRAAVNLGGCTASFVSPTGLLATNHHCAYGALQAQSTVERDLLQDGFLARARAEELEAKGRTIRVLERVVDVTEVVRAAAGGAADDASRHRAVERARKELVQRCEAERAHRRCEVASFYGGSEYRQMIYLELLDVRLVYAPPAAIGEYGGEVDNWMWPRHTG
ncbi:MAG: S46 family peptidase, partial [Myxococcales bacterium]|nr:S46 family peptidase [Myxococcales bacterium]